MRKVYRRRRLVALAVVLAVIAVLLVILSGIGQTEDSPSGTAQGTGSQISASGVYPASYDTEARTTDPRAISATRSLSYVNAEGEPMVPLTDSATTEVVPEFATAVPEIAAPLRL